jgi:hypothetical protein
LLRARYGYFRANIRGPVPHPRVLSFGTRRVTASLFVDWPTPNPNPPRMEQIQNFIRATQI